MMELGITRCFEDARVTGILIDPLEKNLRAIRFYDKLGFWFDEYRVFGEDATAVYKLGKDAVVHLIRPA